MVEMQVVQSSSIEAIGYDEGALQLFVRFLKTGETYVYFNFEPWMYEEFRSADSIGTFFNQRIKVQYEFAKA